MTVPAATTQVTRPPFHGARVLVDGLDHPEGVAYDHRRDLLYAGGEAGQVYGVDVVSGAVTEVGSVPGFCLGLAVDRHGRLLVCDGAGGTVWLLGGDRAAPLLDTVADRRLVLPNYPAFAPDGTLFVTDSGAWKQNDGAIVRVRPDGAAELLDPGLSDFPNGCAVTPDGTELWVLQSLGVALHRFPVAGGPPAEVLRLPGTVPDGIAFTAGGGALLTCYRPDRIYHLDASGGVTIVADDPEGTLLAAPTNVSFLGGDRSRVVSANLGRWHLTLFDTEFQGVVPHAPAAWAADVLAPDVPRQPPRGAHA
jgi:gluconolactonase